MNELSWLLALRPAWKVISRHSLSVQLAVSFRTLITHGELPGPEADAGTRAFPASTRTGWPERTASRGPAGWGGGLGRRQARPSPSKLAGQGLSAPRELLTHWTRGSQGLLHPDLSSSVGGRCGQARPCVVPPLLPRSLASGMKAWVEKTEPHPTPL